jgi:hypothetical protein
LQRHSKNSTKPSSWWIAKRNVKNSRIV